MSLTRGRRCQPRPVPSLTEAAVSLLNATLRWQTWVRLSQDLSMRVVVWVCLEGVFIRLIRTPVKAVVCRPAGELKTPEVCCWLYTSTHSIRGFVTGFVLATHGWRHILWSPPVCFHPVGDPRIILCFGCYTREWKRVEQIYFRARLLFVQDWAFFSSFLFFLLIVFSPGWQSAEMPLCNLTSYYNFSLLINWNMSWNHHV